jgi:predicted nuclease of predicted toxin-antitoxin system
VKLLIDMNLSPLWVDFFAQHALDAVHWSSLGSPKTPDTGIMLHAVDNGYVVFTHDLDFGNLLAITQSRGPSVIQVRGQDVLPSAIGSAVMSAIEAARSHLESGALVTVDIARHRTRILPIGS